MFYQSNFNFTHLWIRFQCQENVISCRACSSFGT